MGIMPLYPRLPVSGARPSPGYDFSRPDFLAIPDVVALESEQAASQAPTAGPTDASAGQKPKRTLAAREHLGLGSESHKPPPAKRDSRPSDAAGPGEEEAGSVRAAAEVSTDVLRFHLEYRKFSESLAAIYEVPLHAQPELSKQSAQLLENILLALEILPAQDAAAAEKFSWPLLDDLPVEETSARHATQALLGFVAMRQQRDGFSNLLLFTNQSGQLVDLLPSETESADYRHEKLACWITRVASLQEMLSVPAMKREVWQELQPLRKRLRAD